MSAEQARFAQFCQARAFGRAAAIARAFDHSADDLGIVLRKPSELFWRNNDDHPIARLIMDRLQVDGGTDSEGDDYAGDNALSKDDFISLFKVLANAMEPMSAGATRMRLAKNVVKRVDLRCDLVNEMPCWFRESTKTVDGKPETVFDAFVERFSYPGHRNSLNVNYVRPDDETDQSILDFVKTCHAHELIGDKAIASAAASEEETVAKSVIEIVGIEPVLAWRYEDGFSVLHQAIWDQKSPAVIERLLGMGSDPKVQTVKFDNALQPAVFVKSRHLPRLLQAADWSVGELSSALEKLHSPDEKALQIQGLLQAAMALASMRQIRRGVTP